MDLEKRLKELSKCIIITDERVGLKASKEEVNSLQADLNQVQNEINDIKARLAVQESDKTAEEAKINNEFIKDAVLPDTDIKYEPITVPTGSTLQRSENAEKYKIPFDEPKVDIDSDAFCLKTSQGSVIVLENCVIVQSPAETRTIYF